jgi:hypothetical protein
MYCLRVATGQQDDGGTGAGDERIIPMYEHLRATHPAFEAVDDALSPDKKLCGVAGVPLWR